ncbi:MAG: AMP-binding protein, partial [Kiritimatiellae bacterium]|nr:AMP-binding protein [Kiritimatiellia bacterium]
MIAVGGEDCIFYAIVLSPDIDLTESVKNKIIHKIVPEEPVHEDRIYKRYTEVVKNENGTPVSIKFKNENEFNFAFDIVDALGQEKPEKRAMMYVSNDGSFEKAFTFNEMSRASNQCANYFKALGIKKGDRVMLVLKRHYQYWFAMLGLNKLGAVAIPAPNQLMRHDFEYRFEAAGVSAILCTADGICADEIEAAEAKYSGKMTKILVNAPGSDVKRDGWH